MKNKQMLEFGPFRLDPESRLLWRGEQRLSLTPKVFDTLRYMAENPGRLLTKEELLRGIWPDRFVEESNLAQNISVLRRTLSEVDDNVKYIATSHGRGYQFLPVVRVVDTGQSAAPPPAPTPSRGKRSWVLRAAGALVLLVILLFAATRSGERPTEVFERVPLTRLPGSESQPALTRDGTKLAFIWDRERAGVPGLFVKSADDDEPRVVSVGVDDHGSPAWSPDGRHLAYLRPGTSALHLIVKSERSGEERVVAELYRTRYGLNCRHLDWSPDGTHLLVDDKEKPDEPLGLFLIDLSSGARTRLTKPDTDIIGDVDPRFSPDGQAVSFVRMNDRFQHELLVVPAAGGAPKVLAGGRERISGHDWTTEGNSVVFASSQSGGQYELWDKPFRAGNPRKLGISSPNPIQLVIARIGRKMVYSDVLQDLNIWRLDLRAAAQRKEIWSRVIASTAEDTLPQLSPDGRRLCFRSDRSGQDQLWISDADGTHVSQLTHGSMRPVAGRWSPDSTTIAFHGAASSRMYTVDTGGGSPRSVGLQNVVGGHPSFSLDGQHLYYNSNGLRSITRNGKEGPAYVPPPVHERVASPDGKYLYYTAGRTDTTIRRFEFATGRIEAAVHSLLAGYWGAWTLGARGIYFLADGGATATVRVHELDTGREVDLASFPGPLPPIGTSLWSVSPEDRWLYCVRVDVSTSDLMEVRGFR